MTGVNPFSLLAFGPGGRRPVSRKLTRKEPAEGVPPPAGSFVAPQPLDAGRAAGFPLLFLPQGYSIVAKAPGFSPRLAGTRAADSEP
jgi:hypothetical protein